MLRFDRKQQNSVKQLSFNKKNKLKKKKNASILLLCAPLYQRIWHLSETGVPREGGVGARKGGVEELIPLWHIFISGFCFEKKKKVVVKVLVTQSYLTLVTPWTIASQAPLSMEFSRQVY